MWTLHLNPRFSDTDALGHINNANLPRWFEEAQGAVIPPVQPGSGHP